MSDSNTALMREAAELFRFYEASHRARGPEHLAKAERNADIATRIEAVLTVPAPVAPPVDMVLHCPSCGIQHIDEPEPVVKTALDPNGVLTWTNPPHRSHLCHGCGHIWRPSDVPTNGVRAVGTKGKADSPIAAPAPVAQTDEQIVKIAVECHHVSPSEFYFARAIERAHGIGGAP